MEQDGLAYIDPTQTFFRARINEKDKPMENKT